MPLSAATVRASREHLAFMDGAVSKSSERPVQGLEAIVVIPFRIAGRTPLPGVGGVIAVCESDSREPRRDVEERPSMQIGQACSHAESFDRFLYAVSRANPCASVVTSVKRGPRGKRRPCEHSPNCRQCQPGTMRQSGNVVVQRLNIAIRILPNFKWREEGKCTRVLSVHVGAFSDRAKAGWSKGVC